MQARRLPARQGIGWVIAAFQLFRANPPLLTILGFFYLMLTMLMLVLPGGIGGAFFPLVQPMLMLIVANGCRSIASGKKLATPLDLLGEIRGRSKQLLQLGSLQLAGSLLVMLIVLTLGLKPDPQKPEELIRVMALTAVLSSPLLLAFWFAPLLTGWQDVPPVKSVFFSLVATLRNWRAFLVYGLTLAAIILLPATLAVFATQVSASFGQVLSTAVEILIVVVLIPIFLAGSYVSYRDIFTAMTPANE
jgi:hypothetical protein